MCGQFRPSCLISCHERQSSTLAQTKDATLLTSASCNAWLYTCRHLSSNLAPHYARRSGISTIGNQRLTALNCRYLPFQEIQ